MSTEPQRTCPSCGNEFAGAMEFCPVCMLHKALAGGVQSGESFASEDTAKPTTPEQAVHRFGHYELVTGEDGKPVELDRGAMGVTYKAFDVDLHCPVTLKEPLRVGKILRETLRHCESFIDDAAPLGLPMFLVFWKLGA